MSRYLTMDEAIQYLGVSRTTFRRYMREGLPSYKTESGKRLFLSDYIYRWEGQHLEARNNSITVKEAAALLNVPVCRIYRWIKDGLPVRKDGCLRINKQSLLKWANILPVEDSNEQKPLKEANNNALSIEELKLAMGWSHSRVYYYIGRGIPCFRETILSPLKFKLDEVKEWLSKEEEHTGWMTVPEAVSYKRVSRQTFYNWLSQGLPCKRFRMEGSLYVKKEDLDQIDKYIHPNVSLSDGLAEYPG